MGANAVHHGCCEALHLGGAQGAIAAPAIARATVDHGIAQERARHRFCVHRPGSWIRPGKALSVQRGKQCLPGWNRGRVDIKRPFDEQVGRSRVVIPNRCWVRRAAALAVVNHASIGQCRR